MMLLTTENTTWEGLLTSGTGKCISVGILQYQPCNGSITTLVKSLKPINLTPFNHAVICHITVFYEAFGLINDAKAWHTRGLSLVAKLGENGLIPLRWVALNSGDKLKNPLRRGFWIQTRRHILL